MENSNGYQEMDQMLEFAEMDEENEMRLRQEGFNEEEEMIMRMEEEMDEEMNYLSDVEDDDYDNGDLIDEYYKEEEKEIKMKEDAVQRYEEDVLIKKLNEMEEIVNEEEKEEVEINI
ncbi:coiled-coil domain-containing glutamate-rich protein 1-like [Leptopilina heterotoma]|uniref:coiled-coil domain-containing glutamate-rich protein 1-like n=1 Tax=Leptopilina heterotoma TaxID=63436 RepID=UPI001CA8D8AF|nr:coiled-coil domain-containing glutamate-rich protein 1-like [Leptopilina heterotoma]